MMIFLTILIVYVIFSYILTFFILKNLKRFSEHHWYNICLVTGSSKTSILLFSPVSTIMIIPSYVFYKIDEWVKKVSKKIDKYLD